METLHGFDFFPLHFDGDGRMVSTDTWTAFKNRANENHATDAIFMAHGFRNDEGEARNLYVEFLKNVRQHIEQRSELQSLVGRTYIVAGVFWPSKAFKESFGEEGGGVQSADTEASEREEIRFQLRELQETLDSSADKAEIEKAIELVDVLDKDKANQDRFVDLVLSTIHEETSDPTEGLKEVKAKEGSDLLARLGGPIIVPTTGQDDSDGGASGFGGSGIGAGMEGEAQGVQSFFGSIFGRVGQFLNLTTWYLMKERSGTVGEKGVAACVREVKKSQAALKVHLVGHSLGGRLMAACAKSLAQAPMITVDSLTLLQAAFSHYGFSADNGDGESGFFRDVIETRVVTGPMVATFSFQDEVVGKAYAIASRLAQDNTRAVGGPDDPFGGIGRNGAQKMTGSEFATDKLHPVGTRYDFAPRIVHCLDGSGGPIKDHGDVRNPGITYAFASALRRT